MTDATLTKKSSPAAKPAPAPAQAEPEFPPTLPPTEPTYETADPVAPPAKLSTVVPPAKPAAVPAPVPAGSSNWTDAPAVTFAPVYKLNPNNPEEYAQLNVTIRANDWKTAIDDCYAAMKYAQGLGFTPYRPSGRPAPSKVPAAATAPTPAQIPTNGGSPAPVAPAKVSTPAPAPVAAAPAAQPAAAAATVSGQNVFRVTRMDVVQRPADPGRVKLEWYEAGHKFADIYKVCSFEVAAEILQATGEWKPEHFAAQATYNVNWLIYWRPSANTTAKGNPYKDIVSIIPA